MKTLELHEMEIIEAGGCGLEPQDLVAGLSVYSAVFLLLVQ